MVKIPYNYKSQKEWTVNALNDGLTLCKRLGFDTYGVLLGKEELSNMEYWSYNCFDTQIKPISPKDLKIKLIDFKITKDSIFGLTIKKSKKDSEVTFLCIEWDPNNDKSFTKAVLKANLK